MNQPVSIPIARHLHEPYLAVQTPKMIAQNKLSQREIVRPKPRLGPAEKIARALFGAAPVASSSAEKRRARLIAAIDVAMGVPLLLGAIHLGLVDGRPEDAGIAWLLLGGTAWALCALALSRSGQVRLATGLTVALLWIAPTAYVGIEAHRAHAISPWSAAWLALPIVLASGVARPATIVVATSAAIVVPAAVSAGGAPSATIAPSAFLALVGGLAFVLAYQREGADGDQASELAARNAELVADSAALKRRVEARALELRKAHDEIDRAHRALSDQKRALSRSESLVSIARETADVVHETMAPMATVLGALSEARALADEHARILDYPDTTDADHRAIADRMTRLLDRAKQAAERSAALVHSADVELHLAGEDRAEARKKAPS